MAKIPLIQNPEAPKGDAVQIIAPKTAQFQMPQVRYQEAVNYEKHIGGLMQPEISGRPFQELAGAQMGVGRALQRSAGALMEVSSMIYGLQRNKDAADESHAKLNRDTVLAGYEEEVAKNNIPASQRLTLWQEKYEPQLVGFVDALQSSPAVRGNIDLAQKNFMARVRTGIWDAANKEQIESNYEAMKSDYDSRIQEGDYEGAGGVVVRMVEGQAISQGTGQKMLADIKRARLEGDLAKAEPRAGLEEMIEIETKGESDVFGKLNPTLLNKYKKFYQNEISRIEGETFQSLEEHKKAGMLTSYEDVISVANGNLTPVQLEMWREEIEHDPVWDEGKIVTLRTEIANYRKDKDDTAGTLWNRLYFRIGKEVPEHYQGLFRSELHNEATRVRDGKETPRVKELTGQSDKLMADMAKQGFLDPTGYDSREANKPGAEGDDYVRKNYDKYTELWAKTRSRQDDLRKWIESKGESVTWGDIVKKADEMLEPEMRNKLDGESKWKTYMERAKSWFGMGSKPPAGPTPAEVRERLQPPTTPGYGYPATSMKPTHTVREVTSYRPGATREMGLSPKVEGGDVDAHGNKILGRSTMEDYQAGRGNYVTVAMDKRSPWQGKYLRSDAYPNVVFKVMDNGGYGNNRTGLNWIDIAWTDPEKAKRVKQRDVHFELITAAEAKAMRGRA